MIQANKFKDKDIKKFGKTWIITEDKSQFIRDKKKCKGKIKKEKSNINDLSSE